MTIEEMTDAFEHHKRALTGYLRSRYKITQEAQDVLYEAYGNALKGTEYPKVDCKLAKQWWFYKVGRAAHDHIHKSVAQAKGLQNYQSDPTATNEFHEDLHESDAMQVLQDYWDGLTRYNQTRMRQQWTKEGREWLPFMYPKQ